MRYFLGKLPFESETILPCTQQDIIDFLNGSYEFGIDTETSGLDPFLDQLIVVTLGDGETQFCIDARDHSLEFLKPYLESWTLTKILANAGFDYKFLLQNGIRMNKVFDVIQSDLALSQDRKSYMSSLADLCAEYLNIQLKKGARDSFIGMTTEPLTETQVEYALDDIRWLGYLKAELLKKEKELKTNVLELENAMALVIADMEFEGIKINVEDWTALAKEAEDHRKAAHDKLDDIVNEHEILAKFRVPYYQTNLFIPDSEIRKVSVKWSSPKQVLAVMQKINPDIQSTEADALKDYENAHPIIKAYKEYQEWGKRTSTYGMPFLEHMHPDGRIRTNFHPIVATGRMSSSKPNMQNIPALNEYRNCFMPNYDGWVFVSADFSGQELGLIAHGSQEQVWLKALSEGKDLHSICAELVFKDAWFNAADADCAYYKLENGVMAQEKCNCKKHKKLRDAVKTLNFGLAYGLSDHSFASRMGISKKEASELINEYFNSFPSIKQFLDDMGFFAKMRGYMRTFPPFNRVRKFKNWRGKYTEDNIMSSIERMGKNTRIQGEHSLPWLKTVKRGTSRDGQSRAKSGSNVSKCLTTTRYAYN